ncbi:MAG: hypothetical protein K2L96_04645 [Muribaculaceae bacterium]|nr:hypothetical protein [Muribaculaceae bacterium]
MKKVYTFLVMLVALLVPTSALAANITLNIDDPSRVSVLINENPYPYITAGDNAISGCFKVTLTATEGNVLKAVNWVGGYYDIPVENNSANFGTFSDGAKYYVITESAAVAQKAVVKMDVDVASAVKVSVSETSRNIELKDGLNEVSYDPDTEKTLKIYSAVTTQLPLYSVTVDGTATKLTETNGVYFLTLPCEGTVKIQSQYPAQERKINFTFSDTAVGFLTKVTKGTSSDGEEVPVVDGVATVNAGTIVYLHGNTEDYYVVTYQVDGSTLDFSTPQRLIVKDEDVNVYIDANEYAEFTVTLTIQHPEAVTARYGSVMYPGSQFELVAGENTVLLNENKTSIVLTPTGANDTNVVSVTHNGEDIEANYNGLYQIADLRMGDKIVVETTGLVRDQHAVVYLDNEDENLWTLKSARGNEIALHSGYNHLQVCAQDSPFSLEDGYGTVYVYVNDEPVVANGSFFKSFSFTLADGSVAKIYVDSEDEPAFHALSFTQEHFNSVEIKADEITSVPRHTGYEVLAGTKIDIAPRTDIRINSVKVDGTSLEADAEGNYSFAVSAPHNVELDVEPISGIQAVDSTPAAGVIYNMQGIRVQGSDVKSLPAGLYIVDGQKVLVK